MFIHSTYIIMKCMYSQGIICLSQGAVAGICMGCILISSAVTLIVTLMVMRSVTSSKTGKGKILPSIIKGQFPYVKYWHQFSLAKARLLWSVIKMCKIICNTIIEKHKKCFPKLFNVNQK